MKLTVSQRNALLAAHFGALTYYPPEPGWRPEGWFSETPRRFLHGDSIVWGRLANPTHSGLALLRRGLLDVAGRGVRLSPEGLVFYEQITTPEIREAYSRVQRRAERDAEQARHDQAERSWLDRHSDQLHELRVRSIDRGHARHHIDHVMLRLARQLAAGANDVDSILAELRAQHQQMQELEREQEADDEIRAALEADKPADQAA